MASEQVIAEAIALGRANADRIIQDRSEARARRAQALTKNGRAISLRVQFAPPQGAAEAARFAPQAEAATLRTSGFLVAAGDSWFSYPFFDVLKDLDDNYGYNVESTARAGDPIEKMAYHGQLHDFPRQLDKVKDLGAVPHAALLSGGGDDIAGAEFGMLLNNAFSPIHGWDSKVIDGLLNDRIYTAFVTMIGGMDQLIISRFNKSLPILVHGYDYPVPDGRGYIGVFGHYLFGPWLEPGFREKNFEDPNNRAQILTQRIAMMRDLLDKFNQVVASLTTLFPFVHYVDVRNTLSTALPDEYKLWWDNELHPTKLGFAKVTDKFAAVLQNLP